MNNKKTQNTPVIRFLCITLAFLIICTAAFAQAENKANNYNEPVLISEGQSLSEFKDKNQFVQKHIYLQHESIPQIAQIIEPLLSDNGYLDNREGILVVADKAYIVEKIEKIIEMLDVETDPNSCMKVLEVKHIDPNRAAEVINKIVKYKLFQLSPKTIVVSNPKKNIVIVRAENPEQMNIIEILLKKLDSQITYEGVIGRKSIEITNLIFGRIQKIITPLLTEAGYLSFNLTQHTLVVTDISENFIENFVKTIDSYGFGDPNEFIRISRN